MEVGAHVWLRSPQSRWGWVPARIVDREEIAAASPAAASSAPSSSSTTWSFGVKKAKQMVRLTLRDDVGVSSIDGHGGHDDQRQRRQSKNELNYFADVGAFETTLLVESTVLANADGHPDVKLRNLPNSGDGGVGGGREHGDMDDDDDVRPRAVPPLARSLHMGATAAAVVGGVHDLIGLTHLHEPAILHALRLRYDSDIIYTSTGPILIAINPFQRMGGLYSDDVMERYRLRGEGVGGGGGGGGSFGNNNGARTPMKTPFKNGINNDRSGGGNDAARLPPHAYKTADDAYRAMRRGLEDSVLMTRSSAGGPRSLPADQSILVSGESGAGKTVTTKIVLNYFAMLSRRVVEAEASARARQAQHTPHRSPTKRGGRVAEEEAVTAEEEGVCIEQQVLQSNPILESFGNAKTLRNDNSSRFGKYIDIRFDRSGKLSGAKIETYLLEKVRLIHPSGGERNYHVFYQFLEAATARQREDFDLAGMDVGDFRLLCGTTGTRARGDGVVDGEMHAEMLDAMVSL